MIGSDLDGAFGREQCPSDVETIADLAKLPGLLARRGYSEEEVRGIMHGNFIRFLRDAWGGALTAGRQIPSSKSQAPTFPNFQIPR